MCVCQIQKREKKERVSGPLAEKENKGGEKGRENVEGKECKAGAGKLSPQPSISALPFIQHAPLDRQLHFGDFAPAGKMLSRLRGDQQM